MNNLWNSNDYNVRLSQLITALRFVKMIENTSNFPITQINEKISKIYNLIDDKLRDVRMNDSTVLMEVNRYKIRKGGDGNVEFIKQIIMNLKHKQHLIQKFKILYDLEAITMENIHIKDLLYSKEMSYFTYDIDRHDVCALCKNGKLVTLNNCSSCILYDNVKGVIIGKCYSKCCNKCKAEHRHGSLKDTEGNIYLFPTSKYFELSRETFIDRKLIHDFGNLLYGSGVSAASYCESFNDRHFEQIQFIKQKLRDNNDVLGHRQQNADLLPNRLLEAFYLYFAIEAIYTYKLNKNEYIKVEQTKMRYYYVRNVLYSLLLSRSHKKIQVSSFGEVVWKGIPEYAIDREQQYVGIDLYEPIGTHNGTIYGKKYFEVEPNHGLIIRANLCDLNSNTPRLDFNQYDARILYLTLFYIYFDQNILQINTTIMYAIPVRKGVPHSGHKEWYGDGNQKIQYSLCGLSGKLYGILHKEEIATYSLLYKSQKEYYQCTNSAYHGNASNQSCILCIHHAYHLLTTTDLTVEDLNDFATYCYANEEIKTSQNENVKNKLKATLSSIASKVPYLKNVSNLLDTLTALEVKRIICDNNNIHHNFDVQTAFCMCICLHVYIYYIYYNYIYVQYNLDSVELARKEQESKEEIDDLNGCRSGENTIKSAMRRSGGTFTLMTCSGFILNLSCVLRTESPTLVLVKMVQTIWNNEGYTELFRRYCVGIGYDMWCNMVKRLLGNKMKQMFDLNIQNVQFIFYILLTFDLHRLFIDLFHAKGHKEWTCNDKRGPFHPHNVKFAIFGHDCNHCICEQYWVSQNKIRSMKALGFEHFAFSLFLMKERYNHRNKEKLEKQGYSWEPITNWDVINDVSLDGFQKWLHSIQSNQFVEWKPTYNQFINQKVDDHTLCNIKRSRFYCVFSTKYRNVWQMEDVEYKIDEICKTLTEYIHSTVIIPSFKAERATSFNALHQNVKEAVCDRFGDSLYQEYSRFINIEYLSVISTYYSKFQFLCRSRSFLNGVKRQSLLNKIIDLV